MKIACVSCASIFHLNNNHVEPTGSLVRCSRCQFIFMVHRPSFTGELTVKDTHIAQSILDDLLYMEPAARSELPLDEISEEWNNFFAQGALSIEDFDEKVVKEPSSNPVDTDGTDLPDLSEYENMIDWGDSTDSDLLSVMMP